MLLPILFVFVLAGVIAIGLGKLLRVRDEVFLAGLAGSAIASLLVLVALVPIAVFFPVPWGWIAAIAIVAVVGEAVRVRFAYRAADSLKRLRDLLDFGLGGALFAGAGLGLQVVFDIESAPPDILSLVFLLMSVLISLLHGAAIGAFVRAGWPWWSTLSVSAVAASALMLSNRLDLILGWVVVGATAAALGLALFALRGRVSSA